MAQLLISVTNVEEARIALRHGADFIDLKDPGSGALGALPLAVVSEVVDFVSSQSDIDKKTTSATIGDLPMDPQLIHDQVMALAETGVDIVKIGFFTEPDSSLNYQPCLDKLRTVAEAGIKLIAVLFAEFEYPDSLISAIKQSGFYGVMLDTAHKNGATFLDYYSKTKVEKFAGSVRAYELLFGLAGSLKLQHVKMVKEINPDYIGFRGGVCSGNQRIFKLDAGKIIAIRKIM